MEWPRAGISLTGVMTKRTPEERLRADRARTLERVAALTGDWDGIVEASAQVSVDDEHDPEGATIPAMAPRGTILSRFSSAFPP